MCTLPRRASLGRLLAEASVTPGIVIPLCPLGPAGEIAHQLTLLQHRWLFRKTPTTSLVPTFCRFPLLGPVLPAPRLNRYSCNFWEGSDLYDTWWRTRVWAGHLSPQASSLLLYVSLQSCKMWMHITHVWE